jgi:hypothetical protein
MYKDLLFIHKTFNCLHICRRTQNSSKLSQTNTNTQKSNQPYAYTLPSSFPWTNVLKVGAPPLSNSGKYSIAEQVIVEIYLIMYTPDPTDKKEPAKEIVFPDDAIKIDAIVGSDTASVLFPVVWLVWLVSLNSIVEDIVIVYNDYKIYYMTLDNIQF